MRQERTVQASLFDLFAGHEIGRELRAMSAWLDEHRELSSLVAADLRRHGVKETGRPGPAGGGGAALRLAQATPSAELPGARVPSGGLRHRSGHSPGCRTRGARRSRCCTRRSARSAPRPGSRSIGRCWPAPGEEQAGKRPHGAARQHGHRGAAARAERQQPAVGCGPGDGALAAGGECVGRPGGALVARSSAGGEEARPGDRVHPRATQTGSAVPRADQTSRAPPWPICSRRAAQLATHRRPGGRALAGQG